jgi:hypothetical protein
VCVCVEVHDPASSLSSRAVFLAELPHSDGRRTLKTFSSPLTSPTRVCCFFGGASVFGPFLSSETPSRCPVVLIFLVLSVFYFSAEDVKIDMTKETFKFSGSNSHSDRLANKCIGPVGGRPMTHVAGPALRLYFGRLPF